MMHLHLRISVSVLAVLHLIFFAPGSCYAQNPVIQDQFTADPSARVFNDKVYVFPSHDILATTERGRIGWFCMEDYHVFSSADLTQWQDHGVIVTQNEVPWVRKNSYSMWAPDCVFRNGKYYFYFPTAPADTVRYGKGFAIGVAIADNPEGPYVPQPTPIGDVRGIDPNVFIDKDGQAYLYWSAGNIYGAKLKENMLELDSEVKVLGDLPSKGLKEGPYMIQRNGIYYLTYPHVENKIERLEYAIGDNPLGPFKVMGAIMDESPTGCWTNHHSIIQYKSQWYLFYHHNDYSPKFDKARSVRIDSLSFHQDGTIRKVVPTWRGVGLTPARTNIQLDRYTSVGVGASIDLLDSVNAFAGWKTLLSRKNAWVRYNSVDFTEKNYTILKVRIKAVQGGKIEILTADAANKIWAMIDVDADGDWKVVQTKIKRSPAGIKHLIVKSADDRLVEIDWLRFE